MKFTNSLKIKNVAERHEKIESLIRDEDWSEAVVDGLCHGGWPNEVMIDSISLEEDDDAITVDVSISFNESVPSGCKDFNRNYQMLAYFQVVIDKETTDFEVRDLSVAEIGDRDEEVDEDHFYRDDYN